VLSIIVVGLFWGPGGLLASDEHLEALRSVNPDLIEMKRIWPVLAHPDSLLVIQQLFRTLGIGLLLLKGCCDAGYGVFVPAFLQLTVASALRLYQWGMTDDYLPEGPLSGGVAACVSLVAFLVQLAATCKAYRGSAGAPWRSTKYLPIQFACQMAICSVTASTNHLLYTPSMVSNVVFASIEAADLVAGPVFAIGACIAAREDHEAARGLAGVLHVLILSQLFGFFWFMDFTGLFDDASSPDVFVRQLLQLKIHLQTTAVHGDPYALMAAGQVVHLLSVVCACVWAHIAVLDFIKKGVVGAGVEVIATLELVPYTEGIFGSDDQDACCAICLCDFDEGDELRKLPCDHKQFHAECVDRWLAKVGRCPLCVGDITKGHESSTHHCCK